MRVLYSILYALAFFLGSPYWLVRGMVNRNFLRTMKARILGPGRILPKMSGVPRIWVWALSLGEVLSARKLVATLLESKVEVVISATTQTGLAIARSLWPTLVVLPSPLDFRMSTRNFVKQVEPDFLILVETDIWPRILEELKKRSIPASLVSARLSPRSYRNYKLIKPFWSKVLSNFETIAVQSQEDLEKFENLGVAPERMLVTGNLKFDVDPFDFGPNAREALLEKTGWPDGRYILLGSSHPGEESLILSIFKGLAEVHPLLRLIIAPRDVPKFEKVWELINQSFPGRAGRRSMPSTDDKEALVFLLDTLGELANFYSLADLAIIGKSFPGRHEGGGHNPLEAAISGCPVITGPQVHNFKWVYKALVKAGGALVTDSQKLSGLMASLLNDPLKLKEMGEKGRNFVLANRGSVAKTLEFIRPPKGQ
ncbi:MAG: 3-deoxy-D-manno-octulosonic acid transferase [Deltaproteobacteria bacterium]|jgi:3-deoxy-D-manno-octulosonic-acid transferase|nr:3-deoxy-D-manno-octulosonic acid transferase [Deltaproteobacteria bacterium]